MIETVSERGIIEATLHLYGKGVHYGNPASLMQVLHPNLTVVGYLEGQLFLANRDDFLAWLASMPVPDAQGEAYDKRVGRIARSEHVAMAAMHERYHGLLFTNYFTLLRIDDRWWIVHRSFYHAPRT